MPITTRRHRGLWSLTVALGASLAGIALMTGSQPTGLGSQAFNAPLPALASAGSEPTPAMYQSIREAAIEETHGDVSVDRIDYVGRHTNGGGAVAYIFYVYFQDSSGLNYERFIRVLRTADGTLHVMSA